MGEGRNPDLTSILRTVVKSGADHVLLDLHGNVLWVLATIPERDDWNLSFKKNKRMIGTPIRTAPADDRSDFVIVIFVYKKFIYGFVFCIFSCFCSHRILVETFHVVSECKTAVYFSWSLIHALAQPVQLFWLLVTSSNSFTDSDVTVNRDRTRQNKTFICTILQTRAS